MDHPILKVCIAKMAGMDRPQLSRIWRRHLVDPDYDPSILTWGGNNRLFDHETEEAMASVMIDEIVNSGMALPEERLHDFIEGEYTWRHPIRTRRYTYRRSNGFIDLK